MKAFLDENVGTLERHFSLQTHLRQGDRIVITTDASPYGIGGSYFSDRIGPTDREVLSLEGEPSSAHQQELAALAILVALREWRCHRQNPRIHLAVKLIMWLL